MKRKRAKRLHRVTVWQSPATKMWWWTRRAGNNKVVSNSAEGYRRKRHAEQMAWQCNAGHNCTVVVEGD